MKKLNKKGVTLIELIVSFAIVSVALIYFYQTIVDLHRMYKNSNKATDEFVNKDYALRVLDAYIKKNGVTSLSTCNVCSDYLLGYCDTANVTNEGVFSKVELKKDTDVLATSYYYTEDKIVAAIESTALDSDGNVKSLSDLQNAVKRQVGDEEESKYSYEQIIEDYGKIKYVVKNGNNTIYQKINNTTIKDKINKYKEDTFGEYTGLDAINTDVIKKINPNYQLVTYRITKEDDEYYSHYDIVDSTKNNIVDANKPEASKTPNKVISKDVYDKKKRNNIIGPADLSNDLKDKEVKGGETISFNLSDSYSYYLKFEVSASENSVQSTTYNNNCVISIDPSLEEDDDYEIFFNNEEIKGKSAGKYYERPTGATYYINQVLNPIFMIKENDKKYIIFNNIKLNENNNITYKNFMSSDKICKFNLVEAYKYK